MGRNVNLTIDGFQATGQTVNFPQYEVNIVINWIDSNDQAQTTTETVLFPNILNDVAISNAWLKENLMELMLSALREKAGVDN